MKDSVEEAPSFIGHDKSSFECMQQKHSCSESDKTPDHQNECSDLEPHDIASCSSDIETKPVQCSEDQPQKGTKLSYSTLELDGGHHSQVQVIDEDVDLPHNTSEETSPENSSCYKWPRVKVSNTDGEVFVNEEELKVKYREENTNKKLSASSQDESDDSISGPLEIKPYLKNSFRSKIFSAPIYNVFMLYSSSQQSEQSDFLLSDKQPSSNSSLQRHHHTELNRLATYIEYPSTLPVFAITLAGDGFIYKHDEHLVECNFCKMCIDLSELSMPEANPVRLHWERSPQCPLKRGQDCGNVPVPKVDEKSNMSNDPSLGISDDSHEADVSPKSLSSSGYCSASSDFGKSATASYKADPATLLPSPVVYHQPAQNIITTDSVPFVQQVQPPSLPPRGKSDSTLSQTRPQQPNPSSIKSAAANADSTHQQTEPVAGTANRNKPNNSNTANGNEPSSPPSASTQKGAAASAAASQPKNSKSSKKGKATKKSEASNAKTGAASNGSSTQNSSSKTNASSGDKGEQSKKKLTYADLGILADKPKRPDMAVVNKRLKSFEEKWKSSFKKTPEELAECGMYYAGYADCARCFFCGGGLKNWETYDEPWVEHARWFPKCAYIRLCKGPMFVEIVQRKNKDKQKIVMKDVEEEINQKSRSPDSSPTMLPVNVSTSGHNEGQTPPPNSKLVADLADLEAENEELQAQVTCKICMDEKSSMVFLPCGHMVACTNCAIALKNCPLCRSEIKGSVRAHMG